MNGVRALFDRIRGHQPEVVLNPEAGGDQRIVAALSPQEIFAIRVWRVERRYSWKLIGHLGRREFDVRADDVVGDLELGQFLCDAAAQSSGEVYDRAPWN